MYKEYTVFLLVRVNAESPEQATKLATAPFDNAPGVIKTEVQELAWLQVVRPIT